MQLAAVGQLAEKSRVKTLQDRGTNVQVTTGREEEAAVATKVWPQNYMEDDVRQSNSSSNNSYQSSALFCTK